MERFIQKQCKKHGLTDFVIEGRGYYRCKKCRSDAVIRRRRKVKTLLVADFGGKCQICGYAKCQEALQFHHIDPADKEFGIARKGHTRSYERILVEANKCLLLCANCHVEVEHGITSIEQRGSDE
jgi:5-methylcytosine-specific restriction endonuclease McrA